MTKIPAKCVRLACRECCREDYDGITPSKLNRLKRQGWLRVVEVQSYEESIKTYDDPNDSPPGFSVLDWWTHLGYCPECEKETNGETRNA